MSSTMISCRIFGCLLFILLTQYADARKSYYLENILESLQRLESMLVKQTEKNTFCVIPAEKLRSLISEHQTSNENYENNIQYLSTPKKLKHQRKNKNDNENVNTNTNENLDTDINPNRRRSFGSGDSYLSKMRNRNMNSNVNLNSNVITSREVAFDFSDENEI